MKPAPKADFPAFEAEMLRVWSDEHTFERSLALRQNGQRFSFYDGPPFANGLPHFGHTLVTSIKDALGRYRTMRGYFVERRNGWDCHGLPVEFAIEKELGVSGKQQIIGQVGLQAFNDACRASVFKYKGDWEDFFSRAGRWTDTAHSYQTIDRDYTESVWWMLSQVHAKRDSNGQSLLYRGYKSMPYCPRCETPLSNFEVNEGYRDDVPDPSLYVKFKLIDEDASLLGWTTTPWSLPGNAAVALNPKATYVYVRLKNDDGMEETLILAKSRLEILKTEYTIEREVAASELVGKSYQPVFADMAKTDDLASIYKVWLSDAVSIDEGTGVLHVAPAFGEDDLNLAQEHTIPILHTVDASGKLTADVSLVAARGLFFKKADPIIIEYLTELGYVYSAETFKHTYPFCYRCDTPLLYYAIATWFIRVSAVREQLLETAEQIDWTPGHIKSGRFGKWLAGARDWAISRNRYWGAPLPIWANVDDANDYMVIGSLDELVELAGLTAKPEDLHRPSIDAISFIKDGKTYQRIEEVFDCWFESGSMPVAQHHYPFENAETFEASFPADYIGEGLDQTRLWFYVQHVLSTIVFQKPAYKHVLVNGMIMAADGQKLSKRLRNYPPVEEVFATEGADTLRMYLLGNDQVMNADYMRFDRSAMQDVLRNFFMTLWNSYSFLAMYADITGWKPEEVYPNGKLSRPDVSNVLDSWLLSRLDQTIHEVTQLADDYRVAAAIRSLRALVEDMSNWYVRRSRRRFSRSDNPADQASAFITLHFVLSRITQLLAPWSPFLSDKLWRELTAGLDEPDSVHLSDWPHMTQDGGRIMAEMAATREVVAAGLAVRGAQKIKVRQPLSQLTFYATTTLSADLKAIIAEEVNVKTVTQHFRSNPQGLVELDTEITPELKSEGIMRDLVRSIQSARKDAGLRVDDRIHLIVSTPPHGEVAAALVTHRETIMSETLADKLDTSGGDDGSVPIKLAGEEVYLQLERISA